MRDPGSRNTIPAIASDTPTTTPTTPRAARAVQRALAKRETASADEVQRLLAAGLEVMEHTGSDAAPRVGDIVRAAGLSNQAFYRHFPSRDELIAAVAEAGAHRLVEYTAHQMAKEATAAGKVRAWIVAVLSQAGNPDVAHATRAVLWNLRLLPRPVGDPDTSSMHAWAAELLSVPLAELGSRDSVRDAAAIADVVFGRLDHHLWGPPPTRADVEHVVAFCLGAVLAGSTD
jgi:AcrR family transcriptional regulator